MAAPFRLQSVLRLRLSLQDKRQAELAQAVQANQILREQTREVETRLVEIESQLREAAQQHLDVDHLMALRRFQADTRGLLRQLQEQSQQVEQEVERRQQRLAEARREVKVIETLEQYHRQEQVTQQLQLEQDALDEFAQKRTAT